MILKVNHGSGSASKKETENKEIYTSCLLETHAALRDTFHSEHPGQWGAASLQEPPEERGGVVFVLRPLLVDPKSSTWGWAEVTRSKVVSCSPLQSSQRTLTYFPGTSHWAVREASQVGPASRAPCWTTCEARQDTAQPGSQLRGPSGHLRPRRAGDPRALAVGASRRGELRPQRQRLLSGLSGFQPLSLQALSSGNNIISFLLRNSTPHDQGGES